MRGIVSQAKTSGVRPIWIGETLWKQMWVYWDTPEAKDRSATVSNSRNSDRGGLGAHKHVSGPSSFLTVQQDMEEELGRPVSFGEVFMKTHTRADGSFVDQKAKQVDEAYHKGLEEIMEQAGDGPENSDNSSHSTQRNLTVDKKNDIFLKCTQFDKKGNPFGIGQLSELVNTRKRKESYASSSTTALLEIQEEPKSARQKIADQDAENARRDAENALRDQAQRQSQSRISEMEKLIVVLMNNDPRLAAFKSQSPVLDSSLATAPIVAPQLSPPRSNGDIEHNR